MSIRTASPVHDFAAAEPPISTVPVSGPLPAPALPELYNPFAGRPNHHRRAVEAQLARWVVDLGLFAEAPAEQRLAARRVAARSALAHPFCDAEGLRLAGEWCAWLLAWDDRCGRTSLGAQPEALAHAEARLLDVLAGGAPGAAPLERALADLRDRMLARRRGRWFHHFRSAVRDHFDARVWEAENRRRGVVPDREAYLQRRLARGAVLTAFELFAVTDGAELPEPVRTDPGFRSLQQAAGNVICWSSDVLSLDREIERGDAHNLVVVLMTHDGLSRGEALHRAANMHDDEVGRYLLGEAWLRSFGAATDALILRRCRLMRAWMFAHRASAGHAGGSEAEGEGPQGA